MPTRKPIHDDNLKLIIDLPRWAFRSLSDAHLEGLDLSQPLSRSELFDAILTWNGLLGFSENIRETLSSLYGVKLS